MTPTRTLILDTDIGSDVDDAMALTQILGTPQLRLHSVTTVYGDTCPCACADSSGAKPSMKQTSSRRDRRMGSDIRWETPEVCPIRAAASIESVPLP